MECICCNAKPATENDLCLGCATELEALSVEEMAAEFDRKAAEGQRDEAIKKIASFYLHLDTLETRSSDRLDFSSQAVWSLKTALEAAYAAGKAAK